MKGGNIFLSFVGHLTGCAFNVPSASVTERKEDNVAGVRHETQKNRCPDTLFDVHEENKRTTLKTSQTTITAARASRGCFIAITIITLFLDGFCVESENYYDLVGMVLCDDAVPMM